MMETGNELGILIIAQGKKRYISMARNIAMSLQLSNPAIPRVLVTDSNDPSLERYYSSVIPVRAEWGMGYEQKLHMASYSPFRRTLFIDVDCLVIDDIEWLLQLFSGKPVSVIGKVVRQGPLFGTTVEDLSRSIGVNFLPTFNGGVYYFEAGDPARQVFQDAIDIFKNRYDQLGLCKFNGKPGDEPAMAVAMAMHGMQPVDDQRRGMYTPIGQKGEFRMDALKGFCEFWKYGEKVNPVIMHFGGGYPEAFHYRREVLKISMVYHLRLPRRLSSFLVNALYNPVYIVYVFLYRVLKKLMKGGELKLTPLIPMFRFE